MTNPTDKIVEAVKQAVDLASVYHGGFEYRWRDLPADESVLDRLSVEITKSAILAHTQALMENVTPEMVKAGKDVCGFGEYERVLRECQEDGLIKTHEVWWTGDKEFIAMLSAHMEQMK